MVRVSCDVLASKISRVPTDYIPGRASHFQPGIQKKFKVKKTLLKYFAKIEKSWILKQNLDKKISANLSEKMSATHGVRLR